MHWRPGRGVAAGPNHPFLIKSMIYCTTYIDDLDDSSFEWEGADWNGNIPGRIGPVFPYVPEHYKPFSTNGLVSRVSPANKRISMAGSRASKSNRFWITLNTDTVRMQWRIVKSCLGL
jgi:hypothetical protein